MALSITHDILSFLQYIYNDDRNIVDFCDHFDMSMVTFEKLYNHQEFQLFSIDQLSVDQADWRIHPTDYAKSIVEKHEADTAREQAALSKSSKDHRLAMIGAITGIIGGATGLIALLMQLFQNTPPPAP